MHHDQESYHKQANQWSAKERQHRDKAAEPGRRSKAEDSSRFVSSRPTKFFEQQYGKQRKDSLAGSSNYQNSRVDSKDEEEEPICWLKIEFDGKQVEEIKVYKKDDPHELVQ